MGFFGDQKTDNVPERFTQFLLLDDEKKLTWELDTRKLVLTCDSHL
jgi:hypothetical protein